MAGRRELTFLWILNAATLFILVTSHRTMLQTGETIQKFTPVAEAFQRDVVKLSDKQQALEDLHKDVVNLATKQRALRTRVLALATVHEEHSMWRTESKKQQAAILNAINNLQPSAATCPEPTKPRPWWHTIWPWGHE